MIVKGFICEYDPDKNQIDHLLEILVSCDEYCVKAEYKYNKSGFILEQDKMLLSIYFLYSDISKEYLAESLIDNITNIVEIKSNIRHNAIVVARNANDFISINFDNRDQRRVRVIAYPNVLLTYKVKEYGGYSSDLYADPVSLNQLFCNSKIIHDDFVKCEHDSIIKRKEFHFPKNIAQLYVNDDYTMIRVLAYTVLSQKIEVWPYFFQSLYLECDLVKELKFQYSFSHEDFRDEVIDNTKAYLAYLKNEEAGYFKFWKGTVYVPEDLNKDDVNYSMHNLNINLFNHETYKSLLYNLFVIRIVHHGIIIMVDNYKSKYVNHVLHIIAPYKKAKKYKLHDSQNFYHTKNIRKVVNEIIKDSVVMHGKGESARHIVFLIVK